MGKLNLLKGKWDGRVGQTVGAKWKNKATLRTYSKPSNPNTAEQQKVRSVFAQMTSFVALFADPIKYLSALNTSGMSVRNAIIKLNKAQIDAGAFDATTLSISKGGLQTVKNLSGVFNQPAIVFTFDAPTATNISEKAKIVVVGVDSKKKHASVATALASSKTVSLDTSVWDSGVSDIYAYFLDYRGSSKVASLSIHMNVTLE